MSEEKQEKYNNSKILTLDKIFNGNNCFTIPDYQRAYSWGSEQRNDLINDIKNVLESSNHIHYTGTIVATELSSNGINKFNLVDGQQRLTSLIILLACLRSHPDSSDEQKQKIEESYLYKGKETGNTVRFFSLNGDFDEYFFRKLDEPDYSSKEHKTKAHTNIDDAFSEFNIWLKDYTRDDLSNVFNAVCSNLGFLFYVPNSDKEAGLMFEVINNRGKVLSELEKIKNYLFYFAEKAEINDLYTTVNSYWGKILFHLNNCGHTSNQDENNFLRNTWIVFQQTNKSESYHVYRNLKEFYPPVNSSDWKRLIEYVKFLEIAAETYNKLFTRNSVVNKQEKQVLKQLAFQNSIASVLPLILSVASRFKETEERVRLYELIEKLNFRYYGCNVSKRSDSGNGYLFECANEVFKNKERTAEWLSGKLISFVNERCNTEIFIKNLTLDKDELRDYYNWGSLKYFLANYEEYLAQQHSGLDDFTRYLLKQDRSKSNANYEKEHILAKEENSVISLDEHDNFDVNKRRLGNFVLLTPSLNKSVQEAPIYIKLNRYAKSAPEHGVHRSLGELTELYGEEALKHQESGYTRENIISFIDRREKKLVKFALTRWGIDSKEQKLDFDIDSSKEDSNKVYFIHH